MGGEYRILSHIGRGGMGSVFLALDRSLHRHVAIKVMAPTDLQDANVRERFRTEARIVAALRHPGIVNIHGFRIVDDLYFFVMDYVEGATLRSVIRSHGPLPVEITQAVLYEVGSALQHAHSRPGVVIHRDIKPGNIILEPTGRSVLMDFGISKAANTTAGLTITGMVVGTPEYMSPEQCRGGEVTAASDQYSLGLVAYAMLAGAPPFAGQHWSVLAQQINESPKPIREIRPDCPPEMAVAIDRMLAKGVRERWPDVLTAVKSLGGRQLEEGDPLRASIGRLVKRVQAIDAPRKPVAAVSIRGLPDHAEPGDELSITVTPVDGLGRALPDREFTLESSNPGVLEVVSTDLLRALNEGSARVLARCEESEISRPVLVVPPPVASLAITPPSDPIRVGDRLTLRASTMDRRGNELSGRPIVWASSDPPVARISRNGELSALSEGSATIFATSEGASSTLELEIASTDRRRVRTPIAVGLLVIALIAGGTWAYPRLLAPLLTDSAGPGPTASTVESVVLARDGEPVEGAVELVVGDTLRLSVEAVDGSGLLVERPVTWTSSSGDVIGVDDGGLVVARAEGGAVVTAIVDRVSRSIDVSVAAPVEELIVSSGSNGRPVPDRVELAEGETMTLRADVVGASGDPLPDRSVSWRSSNPSIAAVDEAGTVQALSGGVARLSVTSEGAERTIEVTVRMSVAGLSLRRAADGGVVGTSVRLEAGNALALRAVALARDGRALPETRTVWSSTDASVASIDGTGVLRANVEGTATVTARTGDVSARLVVNVTPPAPGMLVVTIRPWAYVSIDGERHGEDHTRLEVSLPPGVHTLRLEHTLLSTFDTTFVIRSGETTSIDKRLTVGGR